MLHLECWRCLHWMTIFSRNLIYGCVIIYGYMYLQIKYEFCYPCFDYALWSITVTLLRIGWRLYHGFVLDSCRWSISDLLLIEKWYCQGFLYCLQYTQNPYLKYTLLCLIFAQWPCFKAPYRHYQDMPWNIRFFQ
jgi:hypothetical protein